MRRKFVGLLVFIMSVSYLGAAPAVPSVGDGTSGNPYQIANLDNLEWLSTTTSVWGSSSCSGSPCHFIQTADIDANDTSAWNSNSGFSPIGNRTNLFSGSYDGDNHTIFNLTIDRNATAPQGLFGATLTGTSIKDLTINSASITISDNQNAISTDGHGILLGYGYSTTIENVTIANSIMNVTASSTAKGNIGGMIGTAQGSNISNSTAEVSITINGLLADVGGFAGVFYSTTIDRCSANTAITANGSSHYNIGGFVGLVNPDNTSNVTITKSFATGTINSPTNAIYNTGGFAGNVYGTNSITDAYAIVNITVPTASSDIGGFVGGTYSGSTYATTFDNTYSASILTDTSSWDGAYVGGVESSDIFTDSFADIDITPQTTAIGHNTPDASSNLQAESTSNMKTQSTYTAVGWDFTNTWAIDPGINNGYPYLGWQILKISSTPVTLVDEDSQYRYDILNNANSNLIDWNSSMIPSWLELSNGALVSKVTDITTPFTLEVDNSSANHDLFFVENSEALIKKIDGSSKNVTIAVGGGTTECADITGTTTATDIRLYSPQALGIDTNGNLYLNSSYVFGGSVIYRVDAATKIVTRVAGSCVSNGNSGNNGAAASALLGAYLKDIYVDASNNIVFTDGNNGVVRIIAGTTGSFFGISMTAGNIYALASGMGYPTGIDMDSSGNLYVAARDDRKIYKIDSSNASKSVAAGTGSFGTVSNDGVLAASANFRSPTDVKFAPDGTMHIVENFYNVVYKVDPSTQVLSIVAGMFNSDSNFGIQNSEGFAVSSFMQPQYLSFENNGDYYLSYNTYGSIWKVTHDGTLRLIGTPTNDNVGDYNVSIVIHEGSADENATQTFTITVHNTNDAPTTSDNTITIDEDQSHTFASSDFPFTDVDVGDSFEAVIFSNVPGAKLTFGGIAVTENQSIPAAQLSSLVFTPVANENGQNYATFTFVVNDGEANSTQATMTLHVTPLNDAPTIQSTPVSAVIFDTPYSYAPVATDPDSTLVSWNLTSGATLPSWLATATTHLTALNDMAEILQSESYSQPHNMAVDANGNLYIADDDGITKVTSDTAVQTIADSSDDASISKPKDIAVTSDGTVYFSNYAQNNSSKGGFFKIGTTGTVSRLNTMQGAFGVFVDSNDTLYVTEINSGKLYKMLPDESFEELTYFTYSFSQPRDLTRDAAGNLYVVDGGDSGDDVLIKITPEGAASELAAGTFQDPFAIAMGSDGYLYVADAGGWGEDKVFKVATDGSSVETFIQFPDDDDYYPRGLAFAPDGSLYISTKGVEKIYKMQAYTIESISTISGTPTFADIGVYDINLTVSDEENNVTQNFTITVTGSGVCGAANGFVVIEAPQSGLCALGTPSSVTENVTQYTWSCSGAPAVECSAPRAVDADDDGIIDENEPGDVNVDIGGNQTSIEYAATNGGSSINAVLVVTPVAGEMPSGAPETPAGSINTQLADIYSYSGVNGYVQSIVFNLPSESTEVYTACWKYGPTTDDNSDHWYEFPNYDAQAGYGYTLTNGGKTLTLYLKDGALGDDDLLENGEILDDVLLVTANASSNTVSVPLFGPFGVLILSALMGFFGYRRLKA